MRKSNKFGDISFYLNGIYYFPKDIKENNNPKREKPYEVRGVFYKGKWHQIKTRSTLPKVLKIIF